MPNEEALPIPLEIPWKLAATTQLLKTDGVSPEETTISLFYYEPQLETLEKDYPNERLVYLKVTASISPCALSTLKAPQSNAFSNYLNKMQIRGGLPVWHLLFDLKIYAETVCCRRHQALFPCSCAPAERNDRKRNHRRRSL